MWKAALVGAFAFATIGITGVSGQDFDGNTVVITESHISRLKAALRLTPAQERFWGPVEAALRSLKRPVQDDGNRGMVYRLSGKASAVVVDAMGFQRVAAAAQPLLRSLGDEQKQNAMTAARAMGIANLASAF